MRVLGPVEEDQENAGCGNRTHEIAQELLRRAVDPVEVLDGEDEGPFLAFPDEEVPEEKPQEIVVTGTPAAAPMSKNARKKANKEAAE